MGGKPEERVMSQTIAACTTNYSKVYRGLCYQNPSSIDKPASERPLPNCFETYS